ncbi:MAG: hypothetical protein IGR93_00045 [Hydrococcus sp. C42_A2020_068]|uniref:hypothetical protein n=1 Tax=Pleurocapsa sp. PCC 7327 TaxID=118163 RepID=UPI0002F8FAFC|nr:hypothetical protein [Pleurocapsa sp. PCC 7327]MBF2018525.1 hypothetical protein [Hydrococcus sp. C42_A2020_068]
MICSEIEEAIQIAIAICPLVLVTVIDSYAIASEAADLFYHDLVSLAHIALQ